MPIQPPGGKGVKGYIEIYPDFVEGLDDIEGFSHIILIYYFHLSKGYSLRVKPFMDDVKRGVFSTRAPRRPNPIGLSVVKLIKREGNILHIEDIDMVDGTPLLDIKPHLTPFDCPEVEKTGWLTGKIEGIYRIKADRRFIKGHGSQS